MKTLLAIAAVALLLAGCQTGSTPGRGPAFASAQLKPTAGNKASGKATFEQVGNRVRATIIVQGLKPGQQHGLHIHEAGDCSAPDAMSAKGHFNPANAPHGNPLSGPHHAGDLPAVHGDQSGRGKVNAMLDGVTVSPGPSSIVGRGLIVHADPDDYKTQPTGNSGARIACGVIRAG